MKLAFLCNNISSINGVERVLTQRLSLLAESGRYEVYLITYNQYGASFSFPISDKVHHIDLATRYLNHCSYHGLYQYADRFLSKIKYKKSVRYCLNMIKPDIITCVDIYVADLITVLKLNIDAVKVVECHCGLSAYFGDLEKCQSNAKQYQKRLNQIDRIIRTIRKYDKIIVMTEEEKNDWGRDDKVICIPNMLDYYPDTISNRGNIFHRVISIGRYAYQKGYDLLLAAWLIVQQKHPDWSLHIYGSHDGDMGDFDNLKEIIEKNNLQSVCLHSATNDAYSKYCESDFYVMSSRFESFGLVLIEAMSCGLPVISFDCKYGPRSIIQEGHTGILVSQNNVYQMAEAICSMIEKINVRQQMAANARIESKKYLPDNIIPFWHSFYNSLERARPNGA